MAIVFIVGTRGFAAPENANPNISSNGGDIYIYQVQDTLASDSIHESRRVWNPYSPFLHNRSRFRNDSLPYAFDDEGDRVDWSQGKRSPLHMKDPSNIETTIEYDPLTGNYILKKRVGGMDYRHPQSMSFKEYSQSQFKKSEQEYWMERNRNEGSGKRNGLVPDMKFGGQVFDKIFGSNTIRIKPQGSAELTFGVNTSKVDNPTLPENLRKSSSFDFDEKIMMNVTGTIGEKLKMDVNYNTEATFDFENQMRLEYTGDEDEIIKKVEAGNVSLPLSSTLITGGQNLFGVKTQMQFGKLTVTSVFSQQKGETSVVEMEKGAQKSEFEISADKYEVNRHFFLSKYFRDHYDESLQNLPVIQSQVIVNKVEVWITNKTSNFQSARNVVAFVDLGEEAKNISNNIFSQIKPGIFPDNERNDLYDKMNNYGDGLRDINQVTSTLSELAPGFSSGKDYEKVENSRKLLPSEYTLNPKLGYISLNQALNADEVLAVSFQYTVRGETFQVGEFTSDGVSAPQTLIVKLLKGTDRSPKLPTWSLMMKNIYNIGAFEINREDFILNILYQNDQGVPNVNFLPEGDIEGEILLKVMNLDNLNSQLDPTPDGMFDFIEGMTIYPNNGRIIFPVLEPFGSHLRLKIGNDAIADKYVFEELYKLTQNEAQQIAEKNKFVLKGSYKSSSSSEISLNALNVQPGSVKVMSAGRELVENIDYTVDYTLGRVKIINQALLESGDPIRISSENNSLFNIQTKTLLGTHMDYRVSKDFNLGATVMHLSERPLTQKVNIGDEPISNTIWGFNGSYRTESPLLTTLVDKLPFIETKEPSTIAVEGEFAQLSPGHNKGIGKSGTAYIDDFEGSETSIDMKNMNAWVLASTPQLQDQFPEGNLNNDLSYGFNRAKLAWYIIDPLFLRNNSATPGYIKADKEQQSNHFVREIHENEIFPNKETPAGIPTNIAVLNLAYYPQEKGPYNYDVDGQPSISSGMNADGTLKNPASRWGGVMRKIETNDFEAANIEYIEFWMMDPFVYDPTHSGGELYFDMGNISEDVLRDSRKSFENGLPTSTDVTLVDTTAWGRVPLVQSYVNAFDNNNTSRKFQDVGMDGMSTQDEVSFFAKEYLEKIQNSVNLGPNTPAYEIASADPSSDDYHYFRGGDYDAQKIGILERYKDYNGPEGNSPTSENSPEPYPTSATTLPDVEDINQDHTLSETEAYYQYHVQMKPSEMKVGQNFIVDKVTSNVKLANGSEGSVNWYQFKIPVTSYEEKFGAINDFKSIRFMRVFLKGFEKPVILRFARLDLVRDDWRRYQRALNLGGIVPGDDDTKFDVSAVNIEENASKEPVNYVLPPGIDRVVDPRNPQLRQLNEQAIMLKVMELKDGDARATYKNLNMDVRQYKRLKMDVHAEEIPGNALEDDEVHAFIRMGSDYINNYYEYEIPLTLTPPNRYLNSREADRLLVWPDENRFDFALKVFQTIKQLRNDEMRSGANVDFTTIYERTIGDLENDPGNPQAKNIVRVCGNPNLGNVKTVMIGIRNPHRDSKQGDDGAPKSCEVWYNEFRLTDFDEEGGWAANLRVTTKLADLGTVTWAGSKVTAGFGGIEQGVNERSKEESFQYDFSSTLELGKFFPEKSGVRIPMYFAMSEQTVNPKYNPLDPDIPLDVAIDNAANKQERDSIKRIAQNYTKRKSFNLTNVHVEKQKGKPKLLDVSNLSLTYSFNSTFSRNVNTVRNVERNYRGVLSYNFSTRPKNIQPLKKVNVLQSPMLRLLRDFNFYYMPTQLSVRSDISRHYNEILGRNIDNPNLKIQPTYNKDFIWNRYYDLKYNLTKGLKFDFSATNTSRIDEPEGIVDRKRDRDTYEVWKDSIWQNIMDGGRNVQYHHNFNVTYTVPINKIPLLNWTSMTARYAGTYDWTAGALVKQDVELGNTVRNSNNIQVNGQLNLVNLYNKVGFLRKINRKKGRGRRYQGRNKKLRQVHYEGDIELLKANSARNVYHKLLTQNVTVKVYDNQGKEVPVKVKAVTPNRVKITASKEVKQARVRITGKVGEKTQILPLVGETFFRTLMSVRNISLNFSEINSSTLPGYLPETNFFGQESYGGSSAPGIGFLMGNQDESFASRAAQMGWLTTDQLQNSPFIMSHTQNVTIRSTIEPVSGLKIMVNGTRNFSKNMSEYYIYDNTNSAFSAENRLHSGNFSISFLSMKSAFASIAGAGDYSSKYFQEFLDNRKSESMRLAKDHYGDSYVNKEIEVDGKKTGFYEGFSSTSQQVLVPSFMKAYGGKNASGKLFPSLMNIMPNWRITFEGLSKVDLIRRYFKSINMSHAYRSTYEVGSYATNINYVEGGNVFDPQNVNFLPRYEANTVSINEQFNPLFNVDMIWVNNLTTRFEIKRTRNLVLSFANAQLTEMASNETIFGLGYRFDNFGMIIGSGASQKKYNSDLNLRGDLSIRKNSTIIRKIVEGVDQLTSGQKVVTLKLSADYVLSNRFNLRLFYDRIVNRPYVSLAYPTTNTNIGVSVRFTLTQ